MSDAIVVTLDPPATKVKPGQEALVGVTVHNNSEDVETYELALEGPAQALGWAELQPRERTIAAFPLQDAQAKIVLRPPDGLPGATYIVGVRATSRANASEQTVATLEISVDVPAAPPPPPPPPVVEAPSVPPVPDASAQPVAVGRDGVIDVAAEDLSDASLPRTTGQWRLRLRNGGSAMRTFGFSVLEIAPRMVNVEPPEVTLRPEETTTALLTVRLSDEAPEGTVRFSLRAYAYQDPRQRKEVPLAFLVRPGATSGGGGGTAPAGTTGPLNVVVDQDFFAVEPGVSRQVNLAVQNRGGQAIALDLQTAGAPPTWFTLAATTASLPPQQIAQVSVTITPPSDVAGGAYPLSIRGRAGPGAAASFRADLLVQVNAAATQRPIRLSVDNLTWRTAPGAVVEGKVQVQNLTQALANVGLNLQGIDPAWVQVVPPEQMVFQLGQAAIVVKIRPPNDLAQSLAGTYAIRMQGRSPQIPDVGELKTELEIQLVGEHQLVLGESEMSMVRQASYPLLVRNQTNAPVQLAFGASDPEEALLYLFDPPDLVAPPAGEAEVTLTVRAKELATQPRRIDFTIAATGEYVLHDGRRRSAGRREVVGSFAQVPAPAVSLAVSPRSVEGADRGEYLARVGNPGANPMTLTLAAADGAGALDFAFAPSEVTLEPREERVAKLLVNTREKTKAGSQRELAFTVTASPADEDDALPASDQATLVTLRHHWWEPVVGILEKIRDGAAGILQALRKSGYWKYLLAALAALLLLALLLWLIPRVKTLVEGVTRPAATATTVPTSTPVPVVVPSPSLAAPTSTPAPPTATTAASPVASPTASTAGALDKQVTGILQGLPTPASAVFVDLNGPTRIEVNPTMEVPAASTAKLPVMIAVWQQINDGKLKPTDTFTVTQDKVVGGTGILQNQVGRTLNTEELLEVTLTNSDNTGANLLIDRIGGTNQVNATLKSLGFTHTHVDRHFMDTEAQKKGLDNTMSTGDMATMLEKIYRGQLISKAASDDMHRILLLRGQRTDPDLDYMGRKLQPRPALAHLNGVLTGIRNDGGIVEPSSGPFIVVVFLSNQTNETGAEDAIATTTAAIFSAMTRR